MRLEKAGVAVGTQPSMTTALVYEFTLGIAHEDGEIVGYNQLAVGKGLEVYKHVTLDPALPREDFRFTLTHPNGETSYGLIPKPETTFPAKVSWYSDVNNTLAVEVSELRIGEYTLSEDANVNYALDEVNVAQGTILPTSTTNHIVFNVTGSSLLLKFDVANKTKEAGQVTIEKPVDTDFLEDTMAFTLSHSSGRVFVATAKVTSNHFVFSDGTESGAAIPTNTLPYGGYTLTETLGSTVDVLERTADVYLAVEYTLRLPSTWSLTVRSTVQNTVIGGTTFELPYQMLAYSPNGVSYTSLCALQVVLL